MRLIRIGRCIARRVIFNISSTMANQTPNFDAKIQSILDTLVPSERICILTGEKWFMDEREIKIYRSFNVPPLDIAPNTVWKWLAYFDTGYQFWWNKHAETGKPVLSFHHPASGIRVLPDEEWHARDFSTMTYPYDPSRSFFEQMREFELQVPFLASYHFVPPERSISLVSLGDKDSYFVLSCSSIDSFYSVGAFQSESSSLVFLGDYIVKSHTIVHSEYVRESHDCMDSAFLFDCRNCKNCFGATNKRNRQYIFFNEQLTKEEYEKRVGAIDLGSRKILNEWTSKFEAFLREQTIWPENFSQNFSNSTGDYLNGATDCQECFYTSEGASGDFRCVFSMGNNHENAYTYAPMNASRTYQCLVSPKATGSKFCFRCPGSEQCEYSIQCSDCRFCFGCIGLKRKSYCLFNKQYSEEEYWPMVDRVKSRMLDDGEYGYFFPVTFSGTYVPESGAVVWCGATEEELKQIGGNVFDPNDDGATMKTDFDPSSMKSAAEVPDSIDELTDDWIDVPIYDPQAKRSFRILKPEAEHYRALRIPPPNRHFIPRLLESATSGQLAALERHTCAQCQKQILVSKCNRYPDRKIYCTACYLHYLEQNG